MDDRAAKDVFVEALEKSAAERRGFLDRACGADARLRLRVEELLHAHASGTPFMACPTAHPAADGQPGAGEAAGAQIGSYRLLQQIGEGGFGVVFLAEQQAPLRRQVALKIIKLGMDTRQVVARFEQERQALALMDHPNIARVLDAGATSSGRPFFVMDLVQGDPIVQYCDRNQLHIDQRLQLFEQVCAAVQHAHHKGIIHRDLKPSNILVATHEGRPQAKVIDFGIAKATAGSLAEQARFTAHQQFVGTPEYMSPEHAAGALDVDTRTDVYSLGVLLYELLTGSTPFDPLALRQAAAAEMQRILREVEPPKPSTRLSQAMPTLASVAANRSTEPARLGPLVRGELDWIVMKALEKDRTRRYETAAALAADIRNHRAGDTVLAAPPSRVYRAKKLLRRHRTGALVTATIGIVLLVALVVAQHGLVAARRSASDAGRHAEMAQAVNLFLNHDVLHAIIPAGERAAATGKDVRLRDVFNEAARRLDAASQPGGRFADKPLVEVALRETLGHGLMNLGEASPAEPHLLRAADLCRRHLPADDAMAFRVTSLLAQLRSDQGRHGEAEEQLAALEARTLAAAGAEHPATAAVRVARARELERLGHLAQAERLYQEAAATYTRIRGEADPDTMGARNGLGEVYRQAGRWQEAEAIFRPLTAIATRTLGAKHPDTLCYLGNLAAVLWDQRRYEEAEPLMVSNLAISRETFSPGHPYLVNGLRNLANLRHAMGDTAGALQLCRELVQMTESVLGPEHESTLAAMSDLGRRLGDTEQPAEAERLLLRALAGQRQRNPEDTETLRTIHRLARVYQGGARHAEAEALLLQLCEIRGRRQGEGAEETLATRWELAQLYVAMERLADARTLLTEILALVRRSPDGLGHPLARGCLRSLVSVLKAMGRREEAKQLVDELAAWQAAHPGKPR